MTLPPQASPHTNKRKLACTSWLFCLPTLGASYRWAAKQDPLATLKKLQEAFTPCQWPDLVDLEVNSGESLQKEKSIRHGGTNLESQYLGTEAEGQKDL